MAKPKIEKIKDKNPPTAPDVDRKSTVPFYQQERFDASFLRNQRIFLEHTIYGTDAATAGNYGVFWIAPIPCTIVSVREVHQTAGSDASAVTLTLEKLTGTQALDAGVAVLASTIDLKGTANTVVSGTITGTRVNKTLAVGDRLAMDDTGTLTAVNNVTILIELLYNVTTLK